MQAWEQCAAFLMKLTTKHNVLLLLYYSEFTITLLAEFHRHRDLSQSNFDKAKQFGYRCFNQVLWITKFKNKNFEIVHWLKDKGVCISICLPWEIPNQNFNYAQSPDFKTTKMVLIYHLCLFYNVFYSFTNFEYWGTTCENLRKLHCIQRCRMWQLKKMSQQSVM